MLVLDISVTGQEQEESCILGVSISLIYRTCSAVDLKRYSNISAGDLSKVFTTNIHPISEAVVLYPIIISGVPW